MIREKRKLLLKVKGSQIDEMHPTTIVSTPPLSTQSAAHATVM
jgi:hypothetical protein